ncbi:hypothetical protein BGY98DRAFT_1181774 [Russula aff. rugulosa BPL654]|nr:hypothetical protein BGY98DRAFT_1181774 [Russula aff. rugulosa BPL654]
MHSLRSWLHHTLSLACTCQTRPSLKAEGVVEETKAGEVQTEAGRRDYTVRELGRVAHRANVQQEVPLDLDLVQTFEGALARIPQCQFLQVGRSNLSEASQQVLMTLTYLYDVSPSVQIPFRCVGIDDLKQKNAVRSKLTRNIAVTFDPVNDKLVGASSRRLIRACRKSDPSCKPFRENLIKAALVIACFPEFLNPCTIVSLDAWERIGSRASSAGAGAKRRQAKPVDPAGEVTWLALVLALIVGSFVCEESTTLIGRRVWWEGIITQRGTGRSHTTY